MARGNQELEPAVAAIRAFDALLEAAKYSGSGARTLGRRLGRRAAIVSVEGAHRVGGAWHVLRVGAPPRARARRNRKVVLFGVTAGAITAVAVRGVVVRRASTTSQDPTRSARGGLRSATEPASVPVPAGATANKAAQHPLN
ncbi:MAG: hypothetical protein WBA97_07880 [Actinophytocola sp.]|uniref:hypothetical protein n=1 Tax=Actinophytocola sp. TaxID=1872138 RepID=UPI003C779280